jgi:hypothetical protein
MAVKLGNGNWAVKEDKLLAYNDNSGLFFNKEFDFSRGTSATYVAKDGLIKTAGIQPNIVNNGDFSELGSELVTNGDYSDGSSNWVAEGGSSTWVIDNVANKISSSNFALYQSVTRTVGKIYKISFDIVEYTSGSLKITLGNGVGTFFNTAGSKTVYLEWDGSDDKIRFRSSFIGKIDNVSVKQVDPNDYWTLGTGWSIEDGAAYYSGTTNSDLAQSGILTSSKLYKLQYEVINSTLVNGVVKLSGTTASAQNVLSQTIGTHTLYFVANGTAPTNLNIRIVLNTSGQFEIDNISVQEIQTDTPRIDFTNDTKGHLLLEPQSTNVITYSEDFTQSSWVKLGAGTGTTAIVTSNYAISPDGTQNASRLQCNLNGGTTTSDQSLIYDLDATNSTQTISVYMKSNNSQNQTIYFTNTFTGDSRDEALVTTEWQRFTFTHSTSNYTFSLGLRGNTGSDDTADILIWGAQAEALSYATSYIPTTGATSTRNADVCNNSGSAQDFNSEEGVLYAEIAALADDQTNRAITLSDGTTDNIAQILYASGTSNKIRYIIRSGGVGGGNLDFSSTANSITNYNKIALRYKLNDAQAWINGTKLSTDTSTNTPVSLTRVDFLYSGIGNSFYGKVRNLQVFTEALTDEQLQKLTS